MPHFNVTVLNGTEHIIGPTANSKITLIANATTLDYNVGFS